MPDWKRVNIDFPTVKLGQFVEPAKQTYKDKGSKDFDTVYGVTNIGGITITGKKASDDISKYIILDKDYFAYNPYRINVGSIGYNSTGVKGCVSPAYVVFKTKQELNPSFLYHYLKSEFGNHLVNWYGNHGGVRNSLKYRDLCQIDIPDVNYSRQTQIIERIDNLKLSISNFDRQFGLQSDYINNLRQQVLQEAIEGKLTAEWRREHHELISGDNHALELLEKTRAEKGQLIKEGKSRKEQTLAPISDAERPFVLPEEWAWCRLGDIANGFEYGSSSKSKKEGKVPVLRMGNIQNGIIIWGNLVFTDNEDEIKKYILRPGDILFNRTNSRELVGKSALYNDNRDAIFAGYLVRFHMCGELSSHFANFVMNSNFHRSWCNKVKSDALGQSNINATKLRNYSFPLPPVAEQITIVEKMRYFLLLLDKLERQIEERKEQSEMLMQSVLREVFATNQEIRNGK